MTLSLRTMSFIAFFGATILFTTSTSVSAVTASDTTHHGIAASRVFGSSG